MRNLDWGVTMSDRVGWEYIPYGRRKYKEKFILSIPFLYNVKDYQNQLKEDIRYANPADGRLHLSAEDNNEDGVILKSLTSSLPSGVVFGQNVQYLISSLTAGYADSTDFLRLPVPFACVATDIVSGRAKVWHRGSLNTALRSTMSIPAVFTPVRTQGMVLVDGGMRNNFPVDLARQMGADVVIGSTFPPRHRAMRASTISPTSSGGASTCSRRIPSSGTSGAWMFASSRTSRATG
jgi:NTE family protein